MSVTINENTITAGLFLTNAYHLLNMNDKIYMYSFVMLFISSVFYHQTYLPIYKTIDKICVCNIVLQGSYRTFVTNNYNIITNYTIFLFILTLYTYIFKINKDNDIRNHSYIHVVSSLGHHLIISNSPGPV